MEKSTKDAPVQSTEHKGKVKTAIAKGEESKSTKETTTKTTGQVNGGKSAAAGSEVPKTVPKSSGSVPTGKQSTHAIHVDKSGLESAESAVSIGFGDGNNGEMEDRSQTLVIRDGPEPFKSILGTIVGYAIRCPHGKMPLQKVKDHVGYWLPYAYASENAKYLDTIYQVYDFFASEFKNDQEQSQTIFQKNTDQKRMMPPEGRGRDKGAAAGNREELSFLHNFQLFSIYRFQIPNGQIISRYIYLSQWTGDPKASPPITCCKDTANIQWYSIDAIAQEVKQSTQSLMDRFWGYEVSLVSMTLLQMQQGTLTQFVTPQVQEFASVEVMKYLSRQRQGNTSASFSQMLHEAKFTEKDVVKIYCDYVQHCFPSAAMTYCSFYEYFTKIGFLQFDDASLRHIFRAMNFKNKHNMLFNEFLLGLAALDSNSPNSKLRFTYIFRYYDRNADGFLDEEDFKRMICDIRYKANLSCDPNEVANDVKSRLAILKLLDDSKRISYKAFLNEASHIGGIMHLFRTNKAILEAIHTRHAYEMIFNKNGKPFGPCLGGSCAKCLPKKYALAYHSVKLNATGRIDEPKALVEQNIGEIDRTLQFQQKANQLALKHSMEVVFSENSVANKVLTIVRKLTDINKMPKARQKELSQQVISGLTPALIGQLCKEVTDILKIEPRLLKVNSPCFVLGNIHGNINDLLIYEEQLWPLAPCANSPNMLFLGDYVDRAEFSIEVTSYLFAMKILAPTKFFLLRGNHEIRGIQKNFTFFNECTLKYKKSDGNTIFEAFNGAFDHLPLAALIDESIFCAHGGIPFSAAKLEDLHKIPIPLSAPATQSRPAWEMLWSDPITEEEYREVCQFHNQTNDTGFVDNIRRSTAYYFTEKALRNFLKNNGLSHVIRAHEMEMDGYRFHHSGLLITVFSSSRYCNMSNRSSCVFVDSRENEGFLKIISLDT